MYGGTGWGCTLLGLNAKVMLRSCEGHKRVNLHKNNKNCHFMPSNLIYA